MADSSAILKRPRTITQRRTSLRQRRTVASRSLLTKRRSILRSMPNGRMMRRNEKGVSTSRVQRVTLKSERVRQLGAGKILVLVVFAFASSLVTVLKNRGVKVTCRPITLSVAFTHSQNPQSGVLLCDERVIKCCVMKIIGENTFATYLEARGIRYRFEELQEGALPHNYDYSSIHVEHGIASSTSIRDRPRHVRDSAPMRASMRARLTGVC